MHPAEDGASRPTADEIDDRLHIERLAPDRSKRSFVTALDRVAGRGVRGRGGVGRAALSRAGRLSVGLVARRLRRATAATEG